MRRYYRDSARDALDAVRGAGGYPALSATLERAGISDLGVYAAALRRAAAITAIEDETRAYRALAQYQGALRHQSRGPPSEAASPPGAASSRCIALGNHRQRARRL